MPNLSENWNGIYRVRNILGIGQGEKKGPLMVSPSKIKQMHLVLLMNRVY